jgi:hypothetical protein
VNCSERSCPALQGGEEVRYLKYVGVVSNYESCRAHLGKEAGFIQFLLINLDSSKFIRLAISLYLGRW